MKIWVEWTDHGYGCINKCPTPNVFTSRENVLEYWRRRWFPSDVVDHQAKMQPGDKIVIENRVAELVEVDEYFEEKARTELKQRLAEEQKRMREERRDGK